MPFYPWPSAQRVVRVVRYLSHLAILHRAGSRGAVRGTTVSDTGRPADTWVS